MMRKSQQDDRHRSGGGDSSNSYYGYDKPGSSDYYHGLSSPEIEDEKILPVDQRVDEERNPGYKWRHFCHPHPGDVLGGKYKLIAKMGWGQTSTVWLGEPVKAEWKKPRQLRAIKIYTNNRASHTSQGEFDVFRKMYIGKHDRSHPGRKHVVAGLDTFVTEKFTTGVHRCLVMEPMREPLHILRRRLSAPRGTSLHPANLKLMKRIMRQVISGLDFLHSECGIVHTDLKADNILLSCENASVSEQFVESVTGKPKPRKVYADHTVYKSYRSMGDLDESHVGNMVAKISDFGLSHIVEKGNVVTLPIQPVNYRAPEVILGAGWSYSADIWNLAVMIWNLFADTDLFDVIIHPGHGIRGSSHYSPRLHLAQMTRLLGPAPETLIARAETFSSLRFPHRLRHPQTGEPCSTARDFFGGPFYRLPSGGGDGDGQGSQKQCYRPAFRVLGRRRLRDEMPACLVGEEYGFLAFLNTMLRWAPYERATAKDLLEDPWLDPAGLRHVEWRLHILLQRRHVDGRLLGDGIGALPQGSDRLELRVEVDAGLAVEGIGAAAGDTLLVAGEGEHGQRDGDGHVDADLAGLDVAAERLGRGAGAREDGNAVAVLVLVDELDGVVDGVDVEAHEDGAEDLLPVARHVGRHVGDDGGADEVAVGVLLGLEAAAVEQHRGALLLGAGDEALDALLAVRRDDGAQVGALLEAAVDAQLARPLGHLGEPLLGLADHDEGAQRHAALAGGTEGGADDAVDEVVLVAVGQDGGVILGAQVGLHALAVGRTAAEDVLAGLVAADEADGLDGRLIEDEVDGAVGAVDDVDDALGEARLLHKLRQDHGGAGVTLRRLQDESVAGDGGNGNAPEGNHGGEVLGRGPSAACLVMKRAKWGRQFELTKGADSGDNAERLAVGARLHVLGDLEHLALEQLRGADGGLGDLKAAQDVALGISKRLALLEGDAGGQAVPVLADQLDEAEHDLLAGQDGGVAPRVKGLLGAGDGGLHLLVGHLRDARDEVVGGRVGQVNELVRLGLDELVVEEVGRVLDGGDLVVRRGVARGRRGEGRRARRGLELLGGGVYPPRGDGGMRGHLDAGRGGGCGGGEGRARSGRRRGGAAGAGGDAS
ncbi:CMGC/SRPK protein kinase [Purpureocillium lavendulum]|uniref:CMGC/SRPK protein kinase n=1 Tax=Purpureocillium lavendulum TaxID=1247861 RepID=A0AB34G354_9HYPO|nr:CMGC/SRPK protein kinase [Purpureocillium lavendulum]